MTLLHLIINATCFCHIFNISVKIWHAFSNKIDRYLDMYNL
jgi:hypothetical protein